jgi:hypothetical protein
MPSGAVKQLAARKKGDGIIVYDSFDRSNSTTTMGDADTGQTWVPNNGTWGIVSNLAYEVSGTAQATTVVDSGASNCEIEVVLTTIGIGSEANLCFRSTDNNNHFVGNSTTLFRKQSGSFTSLGTFSTAFGNGNVMKVVLNGTSIEVFRNGSSVLSVTSSFNQTATKHGLRTNGSNSARWNDFYVREL